MTVTVNANSGATREGKIVFKLKNQDYTTYTDVKQVAAEVKEDQMITLQTATKGNKAIPVFLVGEGYNAEDIASGLYFNDMKEQMEHIFSIEPMKTYREYFTVSTAIACSPESGIDGLRKFQSDNWRESENDLVLKYAQQYGVGIMGNEGNSTILVLRNSIRTGDNSSTIYDEEHRGLAISMALRCMTVIIVVLPYHGWQRAMMSIRSTRKASYCVNLWVQPSANSVLNMSITSPL